MQESLSPPGSPGLLSRPHRGPDPLHTHTQLSLASPSEHTASVSCSSRKRQLASGEAGRRPRRKRRTRQDTPHRDRDLRAPGERSKAAFGSVGGGSAGGDAGSGPARWPARCLCASLLGCQINLSDVGAFQQAAGLPRTRI